MMVPALTPAPVRHLIGQRPEVLDRITEGGLSVVIWQRRLPRELRDALQRWAVEKPPRYEDEARDDAWIDSALASFPPNPARTFLATDMRALVARFRRVTACDTVRISFGAVCGDQCRKFHADYQRLRLITTYLGPGTEWLPESAVRREALLQPLACPVSANQLIVRDPRLVQRAHAGDVLVLRGHDGVSGEALGAVHRSPPIEASRKLRVVLVASV